MQFQTPTIASLIAAALGAAKVRLQLLLLLALLCGICSSVIYGPALEVLNSFMAALEQADDTSGQGGEAFGILEDGLSTLLFGHIATTAVASFLIIPFARASAPGDLVPAEGGALAFWTRGHRSFFHVLAASGLTVLVALVLIQLLGAVVSVFGSFQNAVAVVVFCFIIWTGFAFTGIAHLAIAAEARDRRETLMSAFRRGRFFLAPIAGSLALILLAMMFVNLLFGAFATAITPSPLQDTVNMVVSGAILYMVSALHVAALYIVPDFRDLRPAD
ncbi:MAG: hypothetical protein HWE25_16055 [Alphaproteobacteria bacterium]|nr:hypothetical protein [Alphaproteobacteria bacterium]